MKRPILVLLTPLIALSACCTLSKTASTASSSQLETEHLAFIAKFTVSPRPATPPALPADFDTQVAKISSDFDTAAKTAGWCAAQKQIFVNDKTLFLNDVALLRRAHYFSSAFAKALTAKIRQNYEQLAPR
jgi:hypothetical protein